MKKKASRSDRDWSLYMKRALELAREAESKGDIPIGALLVNLDGKIVSEAYNERELIHSPTAHAEILALEREAKKEKSWRLQGYTMVVTLEPCVMCAGALSLARVDRVVYGAKDPRAGAMGSIYSIHDDARLNHKIDLIPGVLEPECREMIQGFFRSKREKN